MGAYVPVTKVRGSGRDGRSMFMGLRVWLRLVSGRSQAKSVKGTGHARLCSCEVKHSTLNYVIEQELYDRMVENRVNAASTA